MPEMHMLSRTRMTDYNTIRSTKSNENNKMKKSIEELKNEILQFSRNNGDYIPDYKFEELAKFIEDYGERRYTEGHDDGLDQAFG